MTPDRDPRRPPKKGTAVDNGEIEKRTRPSSNDPHEIVFFQRHFDNDVNQSIPGQNFLNNICPEKVRTTFRAVLIAVAKAPPKRFAGGGYWEAMHGDMSGWYEVRDSIIQIMQKLKLLGLNTDSIDSNSRSTQAEKGLSQSLGALFQEVVQEILAFQAPQQPQSVC